MNQKPVTLGFEPRSCYPALAPTDLLGREQSIRAADHKSQKSNARILLAEDHPVNQQVMLAMLRRKGFEVEAVLNGALAVLALQRIDYGLVLMDCEMPEMDGYEATGLIRNPSTGALNPKVPIVAVTANSMLGDREKCLASGMDDYLSKPVEPDELAHVLEKWLGRSNRTVAPSGPQKAGSGLVFDRAGLMKRLAGSERLAEKLIEQFIADTPAQFHILKQLLQDGDGPGTRRQAHKVKGAAANLSADILRGVAFQAEQAAMAGDLHKVSELLPAMEAEFKRTKAAMQPVQGTKS